MRPRTSAPRRRARPRARTRSGSCRRTGAGGSAPSVPDGLSGSVPDLDPVRWTAVPSPPPEELLRDAGLRIPAARVAVLRVLRASDDHPRIDQVIERVRADGVPISTQ